MGSVIPGPWVEHYYAALDLHVRVRAYATTPDPDMGDKPYSMEYEVREVLYIDDDGKPMFSTYDTGVNLTQDTKSFDEAEIWASGFIKFDGCGNHNLNNIHSCGRWQASRLGPLFERLYDLAADMMPAFRENFYD